MYEVLDMKVVTETLQEMKEKFEEDKRIIIIARKDINAITTLLDKMKHLPIIAEVNTATDDGGAAKFPSISSSVAEVQNGQLAKLIREIHNYNIVMEDLTIQVDIQDQQLEENRKRDTEKEVTINLYNKVHNEVENLRNRCEGEKNLLKTKEDEMVLLTKNIKLSTLDIDFIEGRLEARSKLFEDYMESNKTTDDAIKKIVSELGKHIEDIKVLINEFISYETNSNSDSGRLHELLTKIQEKEDVMDIAADLLKKYDKENTNLQQLFDAIRLNNMTNIFELLIANFQKMVSDMASCKEEIQTIRSGITEIEKLIQTKNDHLEAMLEDIMTHMKTKPLTWDMNGNNKDLLDYFTNIYSLKKETQMLKTLVKKIKDKGTEVIHLCRDIINYQEKENRKLVIEISAKTDVVRSLQERYSLLHQEVTANTEIIILQSKLVNVMEENEHLLVMNSYFKSQDEKLSKDVKVAGERINYLEIENAELYESNTELMHSNTDLRKRLIKMEKYVQMVRRNLMQLQFDDDEEEEEEAVYFHDSDDSYNAF